MSQFNYRFYSFVAGLYLSPIQCGIQTAHAVSEMAATINYQQRDIIFNEWAKKDKTIIVCQAVNHRGVQDATILFRMFANKFNLPFSTFHEDEDSMNGMNTACGIIVPDYFYDAEFVDNTSIGSKYFSFVKDEDTEPTIYLCNSDEYKFIATLKSYRLA